MIQNYYAIPASDFSKYSKVDFRFVRTHQDLCKAFARELVDLMKANLAHNRMTSIIMALGPLDFRWFARLCNQEKVSCESLVIYSMDDFCDADDRPIPFDHPLSFRAFYQGSLVDVLDHRLRLPEDQLILPDPANMEMVHRKMEKYGPIDVTYGGSGIEGHYAFNLDPKKEVDLETFKSSTVHMQDISAEIIVQYAMGGTGGNLELVPTRGCSLGLRELLSAKLLHLTFFRPWHAGVLRRALFGPVTPRFPISVVQQHPNVRATITDLAAELPLNSVLQSPPP